MNKAYKRKDGRFEVRVYLGGDDKGRRITRSFYGKTAKEAERKKDNSSDVFSQKIISYVL